MEGGEGREGWKMRRDRVKERVTEGERAREGRWK